MSKIHSFWVDSQPPSQQLTEVTLQHEFQQQEYHISRNQSYNVIQALSDSKIEKMASTRFYAHISLSIRLVVLISCVVSMILILTAPGVCFWRTINSTQQSREICPPSFFPMSLDRWSSSLHFQMRGQNVWGQLAIIILSFLFALAPLIFTCIYLTSGRSLSFSQIIASVVGVIAFLIFGAFETWYATGFDHMPTFIRQIGGGTFSGCAGIPGCETGFLVKGWAGAAALYFLCALFLLADAVVVFIRRDNTTARHDCTTLQQRQTGRANY